MTNKFIGISTSVKPPYKSTSLLLRRSFYVRDVNHKFTMSVIGLIAWDLNESTLRKAISYGKLRNGIDVCKYGKQWVASIEAMNREYGKPK